MGKIVTIYLSDSESVELKGFCDENQCTQYSALKTAVRELLSRPMHKAEGTPLNNLEEEPEKATESDETPEETKQNDEADTSEPRRVLLSLVARKE